MLRGAAVKFLEKRGVKARQGMQIAELETGRGNQDVHGKYIQEIKHKTSRLGATVNPETNATLAAEWGMEDGQRTRLGERNAKITRYTIVTKVLARLAGLSLPPVSAPEVPADVFTPPERVADAPASTAEAVGSAVLDELMGGEIATDPHPDSQN